jgi:hypothetical protein
MSDTTTTTTTTTTATRNEVLRAAQRLREAAQHLEAHARHCPVAEAPAHAVALQRARGMVRTVVDPAPAPSKG